MGQGDQVRRYQGGLTRGEGADIPYLPFREWRGTDEVMKWRSFCCGAYVADWHIASNDQCAHNVRNRGTSGLAADAQSAMAATRTIPIVMAPHGAPLQLGAISSLA